MAIRMALLTAEQPLDNNMLTLWSSLTQLTPKSGRFLIMTKRCFFFFSMARGARAWTS